MTCQPHFICMDLLLGCVQADSTGPGLEHAARAFCIFVDWLCVHSLYAVSGCLPSQGTPVKVVIGPAILTRSALRLLASAGGGGARPEKQVQPAEQQARIASTLRGVPWAQAPKARHALPV